MHNVLNNWDLKDIILLSFIKTINSKKKRELIEKYDSFYDFINTDANKQTYLFDEPVSNYFDEIDRQLDLCDKNNVQIITLWDDIYPTLLKTIDNPPILLYIKGALQSKDAYSISIVGTRRCSTYGRICAENFVKTLTAHNIIITSGLAYGIDSVAHKETVKNKGITYAVLASGIDKIQSEVSQKLSEEIVSNGGAIISEYRCGTTSRPGYFPQRNRIISGISKATLVIESAKKGGSLITARFAQEQGREVFAIPGAIGSEKSAGCNWLIHNNTATLALSPQNMLIDLGIVSPETEKEYNSDTIELKFNSTEEKEVYLALSSEPQSVDLLAEKTNIEISELLVILLDMEFSGLIRQLPGKLYIK